MAPPVRRQRPVRTLVTLGVAILVIFGTILAGTKWSTATMTPKLALDLEGGTELILAPVAEHAGAITDETIAEAIEVIRQRIDASGVSEAEISSPSGHKIVVALPGHPSEATLDLVRTSAQMEFRPVLQVGAAAASTATPTATTSAGAAATATESATASATDTSTAAATPTPSASATTQPTEPSSPSDSDYYVTPEVQAEFDALDCTDKANLKGGRTGDADAAFVTCDKDGTAKYILGPVEVEGARISKASSGLETLSNGQVGTNWVVNLQFDSKGTTQFAKVSERLVKQDSPKNQFGIVLDGLVVSAPKMDSVIADGRAQISGSFTRETAATLAQQLNFGSLPISFTVESEQRISATLGSEQLEKGLLAGLIGLILVVVYSAVQYRVLSLLTIGSLVIAGILSYGIITLLSWTQGYRLSLAGVAGLIVAIGITADSFIVYFERIRDELRDGRTLGTAVDHGWLRARRTIIASDAVNFIAAIVLYTMAVGSVRGFAFTLGLTTVIDLVVVFWFTHPMMQIIARHQFFADGHAASGLDPRRLGVEKVRYAGRGRVVQPTAAAGAADAGAAVADVADADILGAPEPAADVVGEVVPAGTETMTIAERRAALRKAEADARTAPTDEADGSDD